MNIFGQNYEFAMRFFVNLGFMRIRVLTINLAGVKYDWFKLRSHILIDQINALRPDIVFLQETTLIPERKYDQGLSIGEAIGLPNSLFAPYGNSNEFRSRNVGGIGILSRWPFIHSQFRKLPPGRMDQFSARSALFGVMNVEGEKILLGTTHLSYHEEESDIRMLQTEEFLKILLFLSVPKIIIGGDFNATEEELSIKKMKAHFIDAGMNDITWSLGNDLVKFRFDRRIDYIFCSKNLIVEDKKIVLNRKEKIFPSDHYGVYAQLNV